MRVTTMTLPPSTLENTLCSRVRLRILKALIEFNALTPTQIAAEMGINYVAARAHLKALEENDILTHSDFGQRIRYYKFKQTERAKAVKDLIEAFRES